MTDYKQLCAELVAAWDDLPWQYNWKGDLTGIDGYPPDDSAVECARAALAEPEPTSLKAQALETLRSMQIEPCWINGINTNAELMSKYDIIRRALNELPE